jgi:class 3 adenylate cyclase
MRERDLRPGLGSVQPPALIAHRGSIGRVRADAQAAAGAREAPPGRSGPSDVQRELARLEASLDGRHPAPVRIQRVLATVLFTEIVDSTARAVTLGDAAWRELLDRHDRIASHAVRDHGGRLVKGTGDGVLAVFDAPLGGVRCARAMRVALSHAGIAIRAGLHTGEVELRGEDVAGVGVHIAARIAALARSGELLASRTVKDLVAGSEHRFASRGLHRLRGVPEKWELLSVT